VHFFGASAFSFGSGIALNDGDVMEIAYEGYGKPLRNSLKLQPHDDKHLVKVLPA